MNYYNDAVMMAYRLGIWERMSGRSRTQLHARLRQSGPFRFRAAPRPAGKRDCAGEAR